MVYINYKDSYLVIERDGRQVISKVSYNVTPRVTMLNKKK